MVKNARTLTRKLGRTWSHRLAMFRNMATSLIEHERIKTTLPKAKELRRVMDRLVTKGKADTTHKRKQIAAYVREDSAVDKLFTVLGPRYLSRPGGYTRVLRAGWRSGDNAPMAVIEFVDRPGELRPARPVPSAAVADAAAALDSQAVGGEAASDANQR